MQYTVQYTIYTVGHTRESYNVVLWNRSTPLRPHWVWPTLPLGQSWLPQCQMSHPGDGHLSKAIFTAKSLFQLDWIPAFNISGSLNIPKYLCKPLQTSSDIFTIYNLVDTICGIFGIHDRNKNPSNIGKSVHHNAPLRTLRSKFDPFAPRHSMSYENISLRQSLRLPEISCDVIIIYLNVIDD